MKGISIPSISIPSVSVPKISIPTSISGVNAGSIQSAIESAVPDLSSVTSSIDIEGIANQALNDAISEGSGITVDIPTDLGSYLN